MIRRSRTSIAKALRRQAAGIVRTAGIAAEIEVDAEDVPEVVVVAVAGAEDAEAADMVVGMVGTGATAAEDTSGFRTPIVDF